MNLLKLMTLSISIGYAFIDDLSEVERNNMDVFMDQKVSSDGIGFGDTCPTFSCSEDNQDFKDIVFCLKNKLDNPF